MRLPRIIAALTALALGLILAQDRKASGPALHGRILDAANRPVKGALVVLKQPSTRQAVRSLSAPDGSYSYLTLEPGVNYELRAEFEGLASVVRPLRVASGEERITVDLAIGPRIEFEEIALRAGIDFTLRNGAAGRFYQPEIMTGGVAALDYNNDGCTDIFFVNGAELPQLEKTGPEFHNRLYRNNCNLTFTDVTEKAALAGQGYGMGVATADFDNDGFADIFVAGLHQNKLYRNRGDGTFEDVTSRARLVNTGPDAGKQWSVSAGWFDYDRDGWLDLFVANYVGWNPSLEVACSAQGKPFYCHPRVYQGLPNQLFHNNRDGTFTDVSASSGIAASVGKGMGVAFGDFNGDGFTDAFVANDSVPNFLFRNLGNGRFREVALDAGVAYTANGSAVAGMGADFRDLNNDGFDDVALSAMYFESFPLYLNRGKPPFFADETLSSGLALATRKLTGWGLGLYDFDNDGHKDLFVATSHFPGSEPYVGTDVAIPNHIFRNNGDALFDDVSAHAGSGFSRPAMFHGAAFADFDNDGRIDAVVTALNSPARLFRNVSAGPAHWIALRLAGTRSNRDSLGAMVRVTMPGGGIQTNHATTSVGYASSSEPLVRFGLGPYSAVEKIEIQWPDGRAQVLTGVEIDRIVSVKEP